MFNYCLKCGGVLKKKDNNLLICQKCNFHFYINPICTNSGILENEKGEILLVRRKVDPQKGYWDLPGGFINIKESVEESLLREIKEELGVDLEDFFYFGSFPDKYYYQEINWDVLGLTFVGKIKIGESLKASDDISEFKFFRKENIPFEKLAFDGIKKALRQYFEWKTINT